MKRILALILAMLMLSGCQLAKEGKTTSELNDRLVGVFITTEYLRGDFDFEGWLSDHPEALKGGEVTLDALEGMSYAERIPVLMGEDEWIVPGAVGLSMSHYHNGEYWTGFNSEGLCEVKSHLAVGDDGDTIKEEATLYIPAGEHIMLYMNPVYVTESGEYYTVPATGMGGDVSIGGMSQSIRDEKVWKEQGTETKYRAEFTVAVQGAALADRVAVVQMSADNRELARAEYIPGQMPEIFAPEADTAYLIVEEILAVETTRRLYQPADQLVTVFCKGEQIWCLPDMMEIKWSE